MPPDRSASSALMRGGEASLELREVIFTLAGAGADAERARRIARRAFELALEFLQRSLVQVRADVDLDEVLVRPVTVSFETMDDETIGRATAAEIHRALIRTLGG